MQPKTAAPFTPDQDRADVLANKLDELTDLVASLMYDVGQMPYRFMREHPAAREAFKDYETLGAWFSENGYGKVE